jgi:cellulose biosynthesis protein BcsQ
MPTTVAVIQNKGGCGKTSFAVSLYATAVCKRASAGSAALVDLDPQGNATAWSVGRKSFLALPQHAGVEALCMPHGGLTAARFRGKHLAEAVRESVLPCARFERGVLVPANPYMDRGRMQSIELDYVPANTLILDTPPQMPSTLLRSIVGQADAIIVPIQPEPFCIQNVNELVAEINNAGGGDLLEAGRVRFVFNMVQKCVTHAAWVAMVTASYEDMLSTVVVARATAWADMTNNAVPWKPKSKPAQIAEQLWADIDSNTTRRAAA